MFFESPFHGYPTCLIFAHVVLWSTTPCMARTSSRRRPGRTLTLGYIISVDVFFLYDLICILLFTTKMIYFFLRIISTQYTPLFYTHFSMMVIEKGKENLRELLNYQSVFSSKNILILLIWMLDDSFWSMFVNTWRRKDSFM